MLKFVTRALARVARIPAATAATITGRHVAYATVVAGGTLVAVGAALIYTPAGLLVGGVLLALFGLLIIPADRRGA